MFFALLIAFLFSTPQPNSGLRPGPKLRGPSYSSSPCSQPQAERAALMREAEKEKYTVGRIFFIGNEHIRDRVLRRRVLLNEGDLFKRRRLLSSIDNLNRLRTIKPVRLADIKVRLINEDKIAEIWICFKERHP